MSKSNQLKAKIQKKDDKPTVVVSENNFFPGPRKRYNHFKKTDEEKGLLHQFKKENNKKFFGLFGTKRPTSGVVKKHFESEAKIS